MTEPMATGADERRKRTSREAAYWWVCLRTEELSWAEREHFVDWLRESTLHVAEMLRMSVVHGALQRFSSWQEVNLEGPEHFHAEEDAVNVMPRVPSGTPVGRGDGFKR